MLSAIQQLFTTGKSKIGNYSSTTKNEVMKIYYKNCLVCELNFNTETFTINGGESIPKNCFSSLEMAHEKYFSNFKKIVIK